MTLKNCSYTEKLLVVALCVFHVYMAVYFSSNGAQNISSVKTLLTAIDYVMHETKLTTIDECFLKEIQGFLCQVSNKGSIEISKTFLLKFYVKVSTPNDNDLFPFSINLFSLVLYHIRNMLFQRSLDLNLTYMKRLCFATEITWE